MRLALLLSFCLFGIFNAQAEEISVRKRVSSNFAETREAVVMAIENRGLVISYVSHIADMLARTGADLGAQKQIFEQAEIIEFCSAKLSRQMMENDPHNIVLCPFAISLYTLPGQTGTWLAYRKPQGNARTIVEPLLQAILADSSE